MPRFAKVLAVHLNEDGSCALAFEPGSPFDGPLVFDKAPEEVTALNGKELLVWMSSITLGRNQIAMLMGGGRAVFVNPEEFRTALSDEKVTYEDYKIPDQLAVDESRKRGPEPGDVYRHWKPERGLYTVVCRSLMEDSNLQLVTYKSCKNGTYWTRTLAEFCGIANTPKGKFLRFTRVED
jgi:hypothetical protein